MSSSLRSRRRGAAVIHEALDLFGFGDGRCHDELHQNVRSAHIVLRRGTGGRRVWRGPLIPDSVHGLEIAGLGPADVTAANPKLIYARISGMGTTGPLRNKGAFDLTIQAEAGFMSITGERDAPPIKLGTSVFDLVCGQYAMGSILAALLQRAATGKGTVVETSLYEGVVSFLADAGMEWLLTGRLRDKLGSEHSSMVPYRAFHTADGWAIIAAAVQEHFVAFTDVLGLHNLREDPRFRSLQDRVANRKALDDVLNPVVARFATDDLVRLLDAHGIPCAAVNTIDKVFGHEQAKARGITV